MPNEILWGKRFEHTAVAYDKSVAKYAITMSTINAFEEDTTPR